MHVAQLHTMKIKSKNIKIKRNVLKTFDRSKQKVQCYKIKTDEAAAK